MVLGAAGAAVLSRFGASVAFAQDATPVEPAETYEPLVSINREEWAKAFNERFPMEMAPAPGGTVLWGETSDISTTNMILAADQPTSPFLGLIFEGLVGSSPTDGQPIPGIADSWERAADGQTYTFHLNPNAAWHDGEPLTADDVIFSLEAQLNPETGSQYTSSVEAAVASYKKIDDHTVEIVSDGPRANFLFDLVLPVMPKHIWESVPAAEWAADPGSTGQDPARVIGSGPFKFVEWEQGDHATVERNDAYWDTLTGHVPNLDRFTLQVFPDETTLIQALKTGQIDATTSVPPAEVEGLKAEDTLQVAVYPTFDFGFYYMNLDPDKTKLFQDHQVREALLRALDRQAINDNIFLGLGEVAVGTQSLLSTAYAPDKIENPYTFDVEAAKKLMDEAGWVDSNNDGVREKDGEPFTFQMTYTEGVATYEQLLPYLQQQWREIGVDMQPNPVPFPTLLDTLLESKDYGMALLGFSWSADPDQKAMFACDQYDGGFNTGKYCNPEYDKIAYAADKELDAAKRLEMLTEASQMVWNDLPIGILRFGEDVSAATTRMKNFLPNDYAGGIWSMPWVWLSE
ncbi:MAG: ABC transporter substrate-binding protein [Thermomicrobiales bacterium]